MGVLMRKTGLLVLLIPLVLAACLSACGNKGDLVKPTPPAPKPDATTPPATQDPAQH